MELICIRHGQAESNVMPIEKNIVGSDLPLTEKGRHQVARTARLLGKLTAQQIFGMPEVVFSSPYVRTVRTAEPIAMELGLPLTIDRRLQEAQKGDWHGKKVADILPFEDALTPEQRPYYREHAGENWFMIADRMADFVVEREAAGDETLLIVSHDTPIQCLIGKLRGEPVSEWDNIKISNASISRLVKSGDDWQIDEHYYDFSPPDDD